MNQIENTDTNITNIEFLNDEQSEFNDIQNGINFENGFKIDLPLKIKENKENNENKINKINKKNN